MREGRGRGRSVISPFLRQLMLSAPCPKYYIGRGRDSREYRYPARSDFDRGILKLMSRFSSRYITRLLSTLQFGSVSHT